MRCEFIGDDIVLNQDFSLKKNKCYNIVVDITEPSVDIVEIIAVDFVLYKIPYPKNTWKDHWKIIH